MYVAKFSYEDDQKDHRLQIAETQKVGQIHIHSSISKTRQISEPASSSKRQPF